MRGEESHPPETVRDPRGTVHIARGGPTFLGIGAQRAGTTWLEAVLRTHPEVFLPARRKEVHYFDRHYDRGPAWYARFFAAAADAEPPPRAVGEITPRYLFAPEAAERIARDLPDARLVALLRHPVDRAYSQYALTVRDEGYGGSFEDFLAARPDALARGRYREQVARYLERFPRERLLVLVFEETMRDPAPALARLGRHLGVDPAGFAPERVPRAVNAGGRKRFARGYALARRAGEWLRGHDLDLPVNAAKRLGLPALFGSRGPLPPLAPDLRRRLWQDFAADAEALERDLDLDLAAWRGDRGSLA